MAIGLMWLTSDHFQTVFWFAVIPAVLSFGLILFAVHDPVRPDGLRKIRSPIGVADIKRLGQSYWWIVAISSVFTLARFSEGFLILKAQAVGLPIALVPLVLVLMNVAYALTSYPVGALSDRTSRTALLMFGFALLIAADVVLGFANGIVGVAAGVILWGLHMGFTQGLIAALVADTAPPDLRGTAFGILNLLGGIALLIASILAGALWDFAGSSATFFAGAAFTAVALLGMLSIRHKLPAR